MLSVRELSVDIQGSRVLRGVSFDYWGRGAGVPHWTKRRRKNHDFPNHYGFPPADLRID